MKVIVDDAGTPSGNFTADAVIIEGAGILKQVIVNTDGTNNATLVLYDGRAAEGKVVWEGTCLGPNKTGTDYPNRRFERGLYGDITTDGTMKYNVSYVMGR